MSSAMLNRAPAPCRAPLASRRRAANPRRPLTVSFVGQQAGAAATGADTSAASEVSFKLQRR